MSRWLALFTTVFALLWCASALAAPVINDLGTATTTGAATLSIASVTVTSGATIVVEFDEFDNGSGGATCTDNGGNGSYTAAISQSATLSTTYIFYKQNSVALSNKTITCTLANSSDTAAMSAQYVTGVLASSYDSAVTASNDNSGTSTTTPSVTSGTPSVSGEMFIAVVGNRNSGATISSQGSGGWATPPTLTNTNDTVGGGSVVNAGSGTLTYAPTMSASHPWGIGVIGLKPTVAASTLCTIALMGAGNC